jgi:hypothetical protein
MDQGRSQWRDLVNTVMIQNREREGRCFVSDSVAEVI